MSSSWWDFDLILNNSSCQFISIHQKPHSVLPPFENPTCSDKNPPFCLWSIIHLSTCIGIQILLNVGGLNLISFFSFQETFLPGSFYNLSLNFLQGGSFSLNFWQGQFFFKLLKDNFSLTFCRVCSFSFNFLQGRFLRGKFSQTFCRGQFLFFFRGQCWMVMNVLFTLGLYSLLLLLRSISRREFHMFRPLVRNQLLRVVKQAQFRYFKYTLFDYLSFGTWSFYTLSTQERNLLLCCCHATCCKWGIVLLLNTFLWFQNLTQLQCSLHIKQLHKFWIQEFQIDE